ncbi:MAG TPA: hypothetical protein VHU40_13410 [Polyangia bacterium]|nr:hypothetical protein [Polyangia bacterium]
MNVPCIGQVRPRWTRVAGLALVLVAGLGMPSIGQAAAGAADDVDLFSPPGPSATISATPGISPPEPGRAPAHANPRVKLSYRTFAISNVDASRIPLSALQLDLFPLSRRYVRVGMSVMAGKGHADMQATPITLHYGLAGVTGGFQFPARVTPFVEGTVMGGVLTGSLDHAVGIPGTTASIEDAAGTTGIYGRGVDLGAEFYTVGRLFLSGSIGWLRTTWLGPDVMALNSGMLSPLPVKALTTDGLSLKLGLGF